MPDLMTMKDFQEKYRVSRSTVYRLNERGDIPFVHIGRAVRIKATDAELWFNALQQNPDNDG